MEYLKKSLKIIGIMYLSIIGITFIITILNYFNIIGGLPLKIIKIIVFLASVFVGGILIGKKSEKKGWLEGLKLALIFTVILIIFNYLALNHGLNLKSLIYYLIIIGVTVFGSMVGISKKEKEATT